MVDEDAPHHLRRDAEKLCAILPGGALIDESQVASFTSAVGCNV
jgi:hypothetical protein